MNRRTLLFGAVLAAGCNRNSKRRIGVIPKGRSHLFWQSVHAGANAAAQETAVEIVWNGPATETDYNQQLQIMDAMINQHANAICLAPIDKQVMVNVVDRAARQGVPVIIFDSPVDTENFVAQVATDNYQAGVEAARRVGHLLNGKGKIAMVACQPGAASTMAREQGFEDAIKAEFAGITIVDKRYGWSDFAKSLEVAENILTAHPEAEALFASNESSTVGAAQALKSRGAKVKLVGFDWGPTLQEGLQSGLIDSLVVQDPFRMGYDSVKSAVEKLNGRSPQKIQNIAPAVVTKSNLNDPEIQKRVNPDLKRYLG